MIKDYKAIIADLDGTVHRGSQLIPGVDKVYSELSAGGVEWLFISNGATKLNEDLAEKLSKMGLKVEPSQVINSGSALMREISTRGRGLRVMVVGTERFARGLAKAGAVLTDDPARTDILAVALDPGFNYEKLKRAHIALQNGAAFWATNTDAAVPVETGLLPGAGSIVSAVSTAAGRRPDRVFGKPNTDMAEMAMESLKLGPEALLVVGDRLETDILFAHNAGIDSALVLTGAAGRADVEASPVKPRYIFESLADISDLFPGKVVRPSKCLKERKNMSEVEKLYEMLKKVQEPKGYFFNKDNEKVFDLLESLLKNKERYGYMCCPCRLAARNREADKDIICPCIYREPDVEEFGSCYCNLYVSKAWNEEQIPHEYIPERRPPEKMVF